MEEHFKNKLKNHKVDWDKEELLDGLQKGLFQPKSRFDKRWLLLLPLLFISTCVCILNINPSAEKVAEIESSVISDFNNPKINTKNSAAKNAVKTENKRTLNQNVNRSSDKNKRTKLNRSLSSVEIAKPTKPTSQNLKPEDINSSNISSTFRKTDAATSAINKEPVSIVRSADSTKPNPTTHPSTNPNLTIPTKEDQNRINSIDQLPLFVIGALPYENDIPPYPISKKQDIDPELVSDGKNFFFSSIIGKVGLTNRSVIEQDLEENYKQLMLNNATINTRLLLSTDIMFGYQHQSGWSFESGLEYNKIAESFKFNDTLSLETNDVVYDKAFYFLTPSDTLFYSSSVTITNAKIRKVRHNNYHSYFNIPLIVGYRYALGNTNVFSSVGFSYAFANSYEGREANIMEGEMKIVIDNPTYDLKSRIGLNLNIGAEHPLSQRTYIITKMAYQRSPKLSREIIQTAYHSYSIGVGLKVIID